MSLSARIKKYLDDVRASYWFIPTVLVLSTILLAIGSLMVDSHPDLSTLRPDWTNDLVSTDGARAVVSVIAQSMIGVAGVMFSITMLAVSFASGQYGPRLIGNFMRDRGNQWTLGILISTFAFALLVLRAIENSHDDAVAFVPHLSIIIAMAMAFLSVFVMIFHVHHVPETISVSNIIASLGQRFVGGINALLEQDPPDQTPGRGVSVDIYLHTSGYIHNIADDKLSVLAKDNGWTIEILELPGEFMHPQRAVLRVWGAHADLADDVATRLREAVALGRAKTEKQNLIFVAEQLVEIVARAMSPGVNDPFTAISCLHWMEAGLALVVQQDQELHVFTAPRVVAKPITFEHLLNRSIGDCTSYVANDPLTRDETLRVLGRLSALATDRNRGPVEDLADRLKSTD
ncbi:DUF2254 domain-containing protein [Sedimentitalea todarodis]|uniref:DUF2254 domain-containing protein n=1 Tax=Sedimentitalea todarodis TaxID=1631240 RepID=A0ABU3VG81_9RHOB|nr:DUF2254 domain-containing protein [Sedimentitalea todarodis]MDU9005191.1 DUF2254 domain-containing protein [Sedimentitalea todarodis]